MKIQNVVLIFCITVLCVGFNNCSNDTRFSAGKSTKASTAGNGTPYGGNTGNGTPYGGIQKGTYFAFSNEVCPEDQKETIEVLQNPDNSLLVTAHYPCSNKVVAVMDSDTSISEDGSRLIYKGQIFAHESQTAVDTSTEFKTFLRCLPASTPADNSLKFEVIAYGGTNSAGESVRYLDYILFESVTGRPFVYSRQVQFQGNGDYWSFVGLAGQPEVGLHVVLSTATAISTNSTWTGSYQAQELSETLNLLASNLICNQKTSFSVSVW